MKNERACGLYTGILLLACIICFFAGPLSAHGASGKVAIFVSPGGNDAWSGARESANSSRTDGPVATLSHALELARKAKASNAAGARQVTIFLRQGIYFLDRPVVLTPEDSGLTITAYRKEQPVLSGGRLVTSWQAVQFNGREVWSAPVPAPGAAKWNFRELWVNGRRAIRARHPDNGYLRVDEVPDKAPEWTQGQKRFRFAAGDLKNWKTLPQAEVVVMNRWVESRLPVLSLDEPSRIVEFQKRSVFNLEPGDPYFVEGALEALDQPGEWCLDSTAGKVYYLPRPGDRLQEAQVVAPVLAQVLRLEGRPDQARFIENVTVRGLAFSHTEWCFPDGFTTGESRVEVSPQPDPSVGGFAQAAIGVPGAVWAQGAQHCTWEQCAFRDLGNYGLALARGCRQNRILRCEFSSLGGGGIKIGETEIRGAPSEQTGETEVSGCRIFDGGKMFPSAIGIWIGQSANNRLTHNEIYDFFYTGISVGWTWGYGPTLATNNLVAYNHVHHVGAKADGDGPILSDMGGIYTLGMQPGTCILNNVWHDIAGRTYGGWGIYLDEGSSSIVVRSNVVYRTTHGGFHQHYGATNFIQNNIFAFARDQQVQRSRAEPHISFSFLTNIVYFDKGVLFGSEWSNDRFEIDWNTYWDARPGATPVSMKFAGASLDRWHGRKHDLHSQVVDPLFEAPDKDNFRLRKGSPALMLGFRPIDLSQVGVVSGK